MRLAQKRIVGDAPFLGRVANRLRFLKLTEAERRRNSVGLNVVAHDGFIVARMEVPGSHRDFRFGFCGARVLSNVIRPRGH